MNLKFMRGRSRKMGNLKKKLTESEEKAQSGSRRDRRRREILRIAAELFSSKSYHDVTMDEVAHEVGIAKGTIYIYFGSKEKLYLEILENAFDELVSLIEREIAKEESAPTKLAQVLKLICRYYSEHKDVLRILSRDDTHLISEHYAMTERWRMRALALYQRIIEKGIREGSFKPINPKLAALIIYGLIRSVTFYYDSHKSPEQVAEEVYSVIAGGILALQGPCAHSTGYENQNKQ